MRDVDLNEFDLFDAEVQQCPHLYYAKMREEQPVFPADALGRQIHLITRYEDVREVIHDPETFSSKMGGSGMPPSPTLGKRLEQVYEEMGGWERVGTMLTVDPPEQTRYRKLVSRAFTPRAIADLEPVIRSLTTSLIDAFVDDGTCEFVKQFAVPLPVTVIAIALNVPDDRLADFKRWSDDNIAGIGTHISDDDRVEAERSNIEFQHYFAEQLESRREDPRDDILTNLLNARIDKAENLDIPDEPLTMAEMLSILQQLLVAGNETTTKMLTEMMRLFGENPDEWATVRADPGAARAAIEETLRLSTPTQGMWRIATRDTEIGGVRIAANDRVVVMFASANRDSGVFDEPDAFCPARDGLANHLAFGRGAHFCVGANLARLEGRIALEELTRRLESVELADSNKFTYHPSFMLRGLTRLDLEFTAAP